MPCVCRWFWREQSTLCSCPTWPQTPSTWCQWSPCTTPHWGTGSEASPPHVGHEYRELCWCWWEGSTALTISHCSLPRVLPSSGWACLQLSLSVQMLTTQPYKTLSDLFFEQQDLQGSFCKAECVLEIYCNTLLDFFVVGYFFCFGLVLGGMVFCGLFFCFFFVGFFWCLFFF